MHIVVTDSGLGGLSICASLERRLRGLPAPAGTRLTYVNAWPDERHGYNDLPDMKARANVFDRALSAIDRLVPDAIVIACNTLSVVFEHTERRRLAGAAPVLGIIDSGVDLFREALEADPMSAIALMGTKTTIESGVHRERLVGLGIDPGRLAPVACPGLARAIETDPGSSTVDDLVEKCASQAAASVPPRGPLFAGLCCTHYGYVAADIGAALSRKTGREVTTLDPNERMVDLVVAALGGGSVQVTGELVDSTNSQVPIAVEVVSKVVLEERKRRGVAALVEDVSPTTARALISYSHVPALF